MERISVTERIRELVLPVLDSLELELFDLGFRRAGRRSLLQIFIDKEGGVTLDDCERASREIGTVLDLKDAVPGSYNLEVSSPGINRPLRHRADYERYRGARIKIRLFRPIQDRKSLVGINRGIRGETLELEVAPDQVLSVPLQDLAGGNIEIDF